MSREFYVYQLRIQGQRIPFYIGKGTGDRYKSHLADRNLHENTHKVNTIKKALREGFTVYSEVLVDGLDERAAFAKEVELVARYGRRNNGTGCLANLTDGGDGASGYRHSKADRRKLSEIQNAPEQKAVRSSTMKRKWSSSEYRKRTSSAMRKANARPESFENRSRAQQGRVFSEQHRENLSESHTLPKNVINARLRSCNPQFTLLMHNVKPGRSVFRCKHCGGDVEYKNARMFEGCVPKDHIGC